MATIKLTTQDFKDKVFNCETEKGWKYKGSLPAIIDFFADWCGMCKVMAPVLEDLAKEYAGRVVIYKVDIERESELSGAFGIQSIPAFLFIPLDGQPFIQPGGFLKKVFKDVIEEHLIKEQKPVKEILMREWPRYLD